MTRFTRATAAAGFVGLLLANGADSLYAQRARDLGPVITAVNPAVLNNQSDLIAVAGVSVTSTTASILPLMSLDRPNAMIKVPGTTQGLDAIRALLVDGVNVNVTLLFSIARYREVFRRISMPSKPRRRRAALL